MLLMLLMLIMGLLVLVVGESVIMINWGLVGFIVMRSLESGCDISQHKQK